MRGGGTKMTSQNDESEGITMQLPLLERAREGGISYMLTSASQVLAGSAYESASSTPAPPIPQRSPRAGEQYRFHFDMTKCVGCKCCIVACNEQNGNPADIHWRRVGEIEGGCIPTRSAFIFPWAAITAWSLLV